MRAIRAASAALLGFTALACTASASAAQGNGADDVGAFRYDLRTTTNGPGGRVVPSERDCLGHAGVSSAAFETVAALRGRESATASAASDTGRGARYEMTFRCGEESRSSARTISDGNGNGRGDNQYGGGNGRGETLFGGNQYGGGNGLGDNQYGGGNNRGNGDRPGYEQHGVRAGVGGSIGGFDLKKIGLGVVLIAAPLAAAWRMSRRRAGGGRP